MYKKTYSSKRSLTDEQAEDLIRYLNEDYSKDLFKDDHDTIQIKEPSGMEKKAVEETISSGDAAENPSDSRPAVRTKGEKKPSGHKGAVVKAALVLYLILLFSWFLPSGNVMNLQSASLKSKDRSSYFMTTSGNLLSDALSSIHSIPRQYILDMSDVPTPQPDSKKFVKLENDERSNFDGKPIDYYKDDTIEVKCWREKRDNNIFNFAEVWIVHPSQLRRTLVDNVISKKHLDMPSNIFKRTNGVVGMSADYAAYRDVGIIMQYGEVVRKKTSPIMEDAVYDKNGNFSGVDDSKEFFESDIFKNGDVIHTFSFGPVIVDDYKVRESRKLDYYICQASSVYTRAAICQFDYDKHYLLCVVEEPGLTLRQFAAELQSMGVRFAYNLDGGQTGTLLYNKRAFNRPAYGGQREVSDILYFATAVPSE